MSEQELKEWFWDKYNNCYMIMDGNTKNYYLFYDKNFLRKLKLAKLKGEKINYPHRSYKEASFFVDNFYGFFKVSADIWSVFETNYSQSYSDVKYLIWSWLNNI